VNVLLPVLVPLLGATLVPVVARRGSAGALRVAALALALAAAPVLAELAGGAGASGRLAWVPALGLELSLRADRLGELAAALVLVLGLGALWQGSRASARPNAGAIARLLLVTASVELAVLADNLPLLAAACALATLIARLNDEVLTEGAWSGAALRFVVSMTGALALLAATLLIADATGSSSLQVALAAAPALRTQPLAPLIGWLLAAAAWLQPATWPCGEWLRARSSPATESPTGPLAFVLGAYLAIRLLPLLVAGVANAAVVAGFLVVPLVAAGLARALQLAPEPAGGAPPPAAPESRG